MFKKLEMLDFSTHKDLRWNPNVGFSFAQTTHVCFLGPFEVAEAAKDYPVVFTKDGPCVPQAVFSTGKGPHPFISQEGHWTGRYVPAYLRAYPFTLGADEAAENTSQFTVMVDVEAPHFQSATGLPLFTAEETPAPPLTYHLKLLEKLHKSLKIIHNILQPLRDGGLFTEEPLLMKDRQGNSVQLTGFFRLLPQTITEAEAETLKQWCTSGLLNIFYAHLHSISNFGPIVRAGGFITETGASAEPAEPAESAKSTESAES